MGSRLPGRPPPGPRRSPGSAMVPARREPSGQPNRPARRTSRAGPDPRPQPAAASGLPGRCRPANSGTSSRTRMPGYVPCSAPRARINNQYRSADIACRRLAELSRSGNEAPPAGLASKVPDGSDPSTLAWPSRCPAALRRRHRHPAAQRSWSRSFAPGDTFRAGTPVCVRRFDRTARRRWRAGVLDAVRRRDGRSGGDRVITHEIAVCQRISHNRMSVPQLARSRLSGLKAIPLTSRR